MSFISKSQCLVWSSLVILAVHGGQFIQAADVGCSLSYALDDWGSCTQNGCCEFDGHVTDPNLCDGTNEVCCYRNDLCPRDGANFCFRDYGTWISRYAYHGDPTSVRTGYAALKNLGITRVYHNIWADGYIYANSATAVSNGVEFVRDSLLWAVQAARAEGLEIYAWFEYGTKAHYGTTPANSFSAACEAKGWLLVNAQSPTYTTPEGGNYVFCDATNAGLRQFYADMTSDIVANYDIDGIQYDDHFMIPNGFDTIEPIPLATRFQIMEDFNAQIRDAVKAVKSNVAVSYSPSPRQFARDNANVDWENYLLDGIVDEVVPQYYRSTANDYENTLLADVPYVQGYQSAMLGGIRLSGTGEDTPANEVNQMIEISYENKLKGVSFWLGDDLITGGYVPPTLDFC